MAQGHELHDPRTIGEQTAHVEARGRGAIEAVDDHEPGQRCIHLRIEASPTIQDRQNRGIGRNPAKDPYPRSRPRRGEQPGEPSGHGGR